MPPSVAVFTDTYLPTVNGVTYTISAWRDRYVDRGGRMDVVYPDSSHEPSDGEHPVPSVPFPFYEGFRLGAPRIPDELAGSEVVHAHTPFTVGLAGYRFARRRDLPLVVSYHTPTGEYAEYLAPRGLSSAVGTLSKGYERWFLNRADLVLAPSESTATTLSNRLSAAVPVESHPNGVDISQFEPTDPADFIDRYDLPADGPLVGYTGRHGYEKDLSAVIEAADGLDVTVVFGGDGPARDDLEALAAERAVDVRFLGFLDRSELPAFYSALDVFGFPSPVETQGIVALEAIACGTPVVAVDRGALTETVDDGETGYHYEPGDIDGFRGALVRALDENERLSEQCLDHRESISLEQSITRLVEKYERLR